MYNLNKYTIINRVYYAEPDGCGVPYGIDW